MLYCAGLILGKTNKTILSIGKELNINRNKIYNIIKDNAEIKENLYDIAKKYNQENNNSLKTII